MGAGEQTEGPSVKVHFGWDRKWVRVLGGKDGLWGDPESQEHGGFWANQEGTENTEQRRGVAGGAGRIGRLGSPELESEFPVGG